MESVTYWYVLQHIILPTPTTPQIEILMKLSLIPVALEYYPGPGYTRWTMTGLHPALCFRSARGSAVSTSPLTTVMPWIHTTTCPTYSKPPSPYWFPSLRQLPTRKRAMSSHYHSQHGATGRQAAGRGDSRPVLYLPSAQPPPITPCSSSYMKRSQHITKLYSAVVY